MKKLDHEEFKMFVASVCDGLIESIMEGKVGTIMDIMTWHKECRELIFYDLEEALLEKHSVLTESVFNKSHKRALVLYKEICKENNFEAKL